MSDARDVIADGFCPRATGNGSMVYHDHLSCEAAADAAMAALKAAGMEPREMPWETKLSEDETHD